MASWEGAGLPAAAIGLRVPMKVSPSLLLVGFAVILALNASALAAASLPNAKQPPPRAIVPDVTATQDTLVARALEATDPRALEAILGGDAFLAIGKYEQAIGAYNQAISLDPNNRFAYFGRGKAWAAKRAYGQAIADYDKVIELAPISPRRIFAGASPRSYLATSMVLSPIAAEPPRSIRRRATRTSARA
ncbi:tetratricopeptide repeat protein [Mesorhizobium sp. ORM6]